MPKTISQKVVFKNTDFNFGIFYKRKDISDAGLVNQVSTLNNYTVIIWGSELV